MSTGVIVGVGVGAGVALIVALAVVLYCWLRRRGRCCVGRSEGESTESDGSVGNPLESKSEGSANSPSTCNSETLPSEDSSYSGAVTKEQRRKAPRSATPGSDSSEESGTDAIGSDASGRKTRERVSRQPDGRAMAKGMRRGRKASKAFSLKSVPYVESTYSLASDSDTSSSTQESGSESD